MQACMPLRLVTPLVITEEVTEKYARLLFVVELEQLSHTFCIASPEGQRNYKEPFQSKGDETVFSSSKGGLGG